MDWALTGATIGLIIAVCYLLDWLVSKKEEDKQKVAIIKWWSRLDDFSYGEAVRNSNIFCNEIFDKIYGKRHFSLRCFGVSFCVSIISVCILTLIACYIVVTISGEDKPRYFMNIGLMLIIAVYTNCWIDYISLIETRIILRFALRVRPHGLPVLLLVDLFLSAIAFLLCLGTLLFVVGLLSGHHRDYLMSFDVIRTYVNWESPLRSIMFYSTFSTSVIFYIYCLSTLLFKFLKLSRFRIMVVLEKLEKSDNLFKALGGFLVAVVLVVKCVVEIVQHIRQI